MSPLLLNASGSGGVDPLQVPEVGCEAVFSVYSISGHSDWSKDGLLSQVLVKTCLMVQWDFSVCETRSVAGKWVSWTHPTLITPSPWPRSKLIELLPTLRLERAVYRMGIRKQGGLSG